MGGRKALEITPADAMLPEPPKSGKHILLEKAGFLWRRLTFSWQVVIRNIFRNKNRFALLVVGLSFAYGINTFPLYLLYAVTVMFSIQYDEYQNMDYVVEFKKPMNENVIIDLKHLIDGNETEPRLEYPFELKNGLRKKAVNIIGVPLDTYIFEFRDTDNNIIELTDKGYFTEALAKLLDVNKGDKITIKILFRGGRYGY